jgi:hypothetical protein
MQHRITTIDRIDVGSAMAAGGTIRFDTCSGQIIVRDVALRADGWVVVGRDEATGARTVAFARGSDPVTVYYGYGGLRGSKKTSQDSVSDKTQAEAIAQEERKASAPAGQEARHPLGDVLAQHRRIRAHGAEGREAQPGAGG